MVTQMFDVYFLVVAAGEDSWKEILCDITAQKSNLLWFTVAILQPQCCLLYNW